MRQVRLDELEHNLMLAFRSLGAAVKRDLLSRETDKRQRAEHIAAAVFAEKLKRFEILTDTPEPPGFRGSQWRNGVSGPAA